MVPRTESDMTIGVILVVVMGWLIAGCLTVALVVALGIDELVDGSEDNIGNEAATVVLWPLALVIVLVILLGKAGKRIGMDARPRWWKG
jgi:hypothetical protein